VNPSRLVIYAVLAAAMLLAAHQGYVLLTGAPVSAQKAPQVRPAPAATARITAEAPVIHQLSLADLQSMTPRLSNPLERSDNLRQIYERYRDSRYGFERSIAFRAWSACFPQFMSADAQAVTLEKLTQALPVNAPKHAVRVDAYRELRRRCEAFFELSRDDVLAFTQQQSDRWKKCEALDPGELA
jgi:hypothetical protein